MWAPLALSRGDGNSAWAFISRLLRASKLARVRAQDLLSAPVSMCTSPDTRWRRPSGFQESTASFWSSCGHLIPEPCLSSFLIIARSNCYLLPQAAEELHACNCSDNQSRGTGFLYWVSSEPGQTQDSCQRDLSGASGNNDSVLGVRPRESFSSHSSSQAFHDECGVSRPWELRSWGGTRAS